MAVIRGVSTLAAVALALGLVTTPPTQQVTVRSSALEVDAALVERGLRARVGETLSGWEIEIEDGEAGELELAITRPDASRERRRMRVTGETIEDRSRELASALAVLVDQYEPPPTPSAPPAPAAPARFRIAYLSLGPRLGVGAPPDPDLGGTLAAGLWLARDHVQPRLQGSYIASFEGNLLLHAVRFGAGLAAGGSVLQRRLWLGALAVPHAQWVQARDRLVVATWTVAVEVGALAQVRWPRAFLGLRTGVDLLFPPVSAKGAGPRVRWATFRYMAGLEAGVRF